MTKTLPSFAKALQAAHEALAAGLRKLEEISHGDETESGLAALRARLGATRIHLGEHFRFEEQGGYMETVRAREPRLERTIQHLGSQHPRLMESLDRLIIHARTASSRDKTLREQIRAWIDSVRSHEARENELVQTTFNQDLSAED